MTHFIKVIKTVFDAIDDGSLKSYIIGCECSDVDYIVFEEIDRGYVTGRFVWTKVKHSIECKGMHAGWFAVTFEKDLSVQFAPMRLMVPHD